MIKIQFICDRCHKFNPYVPSKGASVVCASCQHKEEIPIPTKLHGGRTQLLWKKSKNFFKRKPKKDQFDWE
jgi:hypothetical protein